MRRFLVSFLLIIALLVSFSGLAFADPVTATFGIGAALADAAGISFMASGLTPSSGSAWYNSHSGADSVQIGDSFVQDVGDGVTFAVRRNEDDSVTMQIPEDSLLGALVTGYNNAFITDESITDNSSGILLNQIAYNGWLIGVDYPAIKNLTQGTYSHLNIGSANDLVVWMENVSPNRTWMTGTRYITTSAGTTIGSNTNIAPGSYSIRASLDFGNLMVYLWDLNHNYSYWTMAQYPSPTSVSASLSYSSGVIDSGSGYDYIHITVEDDYIDSSSSYVPSTAGTVSYFDTSAAFDAFLSDLADAYLDNDVSADSEFSDDDIAVTPPVPSMPLSDVPWTTFKTEFGNEVTNDLDDINDGVSDLNDGVDTVNSNLISLSGTLTNGFNSVVNAINSLISLVNTFKTAVVDAVNDVEDAIDLVGQSIWNKLGSIASDIVDAVNDVEDAIDTVGQSIWSKLGTVASDIVGALENIEDHFEGYLEDIVDALEGILDGVMDIVEAVADSLLELMEAGFDGFVTAFGDLLDDIGESFGIWHYVVEWIASISSIFGTFFAYMSGCSYYMVLPIYACVAGSLCIAFYKRFGK